MDTGTGKGNEIQLLFSGNGQSAEYETRAISTPVENAINHLNIYIFASNQPEGPYYYLETWKMGATDSKVDKTFVLQDICTGHKATIYPGELVGMPYLKLYCVANPQPSLYEKDGTNMLTLTPP